MASKIKKALKKIGKAALIGGTGYALMKGLGKKGTPSTNADAIKAMTSNDAYNDDSMPMNLSKDMGPYKSYGAGNPRRPGNSFKSGGRVKGCGKALRGFGKAMKGKK